MRIQGGFQGSASCVESVVSSIMLVRLDRDIPQLVAQGGTHVVTILTNLVTDWTVTSGMEFDGTRDTMAQLVAVPTVALQEQVYSSKRKLLGRFGVLGGSSLSKYRAVLSSLQLGPWCLSSPP